MNYHMECIYLWNVHMRVACGRVLSVVGFIIFIFTVGSVTPVLFCVNLVIFIIILHLNKGKRIKNVVNKSMIEIVQVVCSSLSFVYSWLEDRSKCTTIKLNCPLGGMNARNYYSKPPTTCSVGCVHCWHFGEGVTGSPLMSITIAHLHRDPTSALHWRLANNPLSVNLMLFTQNQAAGL